MRYFGKVKEIIILNSKIVFAYISAARASSFIGILQVLILYYIWKSIYDNSFSLHGVNRYQIITYVVISKVISMQMFWGINLRISDAVKSGQISIELLKPFDYQGLCYYLRLGDMFLSILVNGFPVVLFSILFIGVMPPASPYNMFAFIVSLFFSVTTVFLIEFITGILSFCTVNGWGLHLLKGALISFFSGSLVPITFFPQILANIAQALPFKGIVYVPVSLYIGAIRGQDISYALLSQLMWIGVIFILSRIIYTIIIKKIVVMGG